MASLKIQSYLLLLTFVMSRTVSGGIEKCGSEVSSLRQYTQIRLVEDGFCSNYGSGPSTSCCTSWNNLVDPALDALFGRPIYEKFHDLSTLLRTLRQSITDLECHKHASPAGSIHSDIVASIDLLSEVNWSHILNRTFSGGSKCGLELTKLMYCSPNFCLYNQTASQIENVCIGHCTNIIRHCVTSPFSELLKDWKRAVGSLLATLRILSTTTTCAEDKLKIDARVGQLNDWRDPLFGVINSCSTNRLNPCWPNVDPQFPAAATESVKSLVNHADHEKKLKSISTSLEKHWQDTSLSQQDEADDPVPSGSGFGINERYVDTDDEDFINFQYGSGSGMSEVPDSDFSPPGTTITGIEGSINPPPNPKNNEIDIDKGDAPTPKKEKPSSSSSRISLTPILVILVVPLTSLLTVKIT